VNLALGAVPVILVEADLVPGMQRVLQGAGLVSLPPHEATKAARSEHPIHAGAVIPWPADLAEARHDARRILAELSPAAAIAIEKGGMNGKGRIHTRRGFDVTAPIAKIDPLMEAARDAGVETIGIGDGGNEIGMGNIRDAVRATIPFGASCACPCEDGIAPSTEVDALVVASVSNWGAYGVEACLAHLTEQPNSMHDATLEDLALRAAADAGLMDGITGHVEPSADGLRSDVHAALVAMLRSLVLHARGQVW
jgi:hypothetical protein